MTKVNACVENIYSFANGRNVDKLKLLGRTKITEEGLACDFTASGFELVAEIKGEISLSVTVFGEDDVYFTAYIDGERYPERLKAEKNGTSDIKLGGFGDAAKHTVKLVKQTEQQNAICTFRSLCVCGELIGAAPNKSKYIEFIGDSITCGYGNDWIDKTEGREGRAVNQDGTRTYAYFTAEAFDADFSMISYSGIGVAYGWSGDFVISRLFGRESALRDAEKKCDFSNKRVPDLVVINLGTNDAAFPSESTEEKFKTAVKAVIEQVRVSYGGRINVVWVGGMMEESRLSWVEGALSELGGERNGLYTLSLYNRSHTGANGHPTVAEQRVGADKLISYIKEKKLLE